MGIKLLRCDDRLIHGQCIVKVLNDFDISHIILIDAFTAANPVLCNIYKMAVPQEITIDILNAEAGTKKIEEYSSQTLNTLVLVKDPVVALELLKNTDKLPKSLNIGPMSNRSDTKKLSFFSFLLPKEIEACDEMIAMGIHVYFQQVPGEKELDYKEAKAKL